MKRMIAALGVVFLFLAGAKLITSEKVKPYYVCNCKDDCKCDFVASKPGKCKCGSKLVAMHLLSIEKGEGVFCRCGGSCTCERSKTDPGKCGCGHPVKMAGLKGKYVCPCDVGCDCKTISDKPGKCGCGKTLVKVS
jgi:hypothetical protein